MRKLSRLSLLATLPVLLAACAVGGYHAQTTAPTGVVLKSRAPAVSAQVLAPTPVAMPAAAVITMPAVTQIGTVTTSQLGTLNGQNVQVAPIGVALQKRDLARAPGTAGLYFYRDGAQGNEPYSVFVNGKYLTTLKNNSWSHVQLCPGEYVIQMVPQSALLADKRGYPGTAMTVGQAGVDSFVQPRLMPSGKPTLSLLARDQGLALLQQYQQMNHTVARVDTSANCANRKPVTDSSALHRYVLNAEVLFDFGKWRLKASNMSQVRALLDDIAQDIRSQGVALDRIEITGHTDPVGSPAANKQLSLRRAGEVLRYLQMRGISPNRMRAVGLGEDKLLDDQCAQKFQNAREVEDCNEVNRRVEIAVYGRTSSDKIAPSTPVSRSVAPTR